MAFISHGFNCHEPLKSPATNMGLAHQHPTVIKEYIHKELSLGPHSGTHQLSPPIHINRFGVILKGHNREMEANYRPLLPPNP